MAGLSSNGAQQLNASNFQQRKPTRNEGIGSIHAEAKKFGAMRTNANAVLEPDLELVAKEFTGKFD